MSINPTTFRIELPAELIPVLDQLGAGKNTDERVKISIAIGLFTGNVVSLARAAELANKSVHEFITILQQRNIAWTQYDEEELTHDVTLVRQHTDTAKASNDHDPGNL